MMYGTRKELNKKLKRMFGCNERFALLVGCDGAGSGDDRSGGRCDFA